LFLDLIDQKKLLSLGDTIRTLADGGVLGATQNFSLDFTSTPCLRSVHMDFYGLNQLSRVLLLSSVCAQPVADLIQLISDGKDFGVAFTLLQLVNHGPQVLGVCDILGHSERVTLMILFRLS
jgi:hypothetical protein